MKITSKAFEQNQSIPSQYTCDGDNKSPELKFEDIPQGTKSLVLFVDDPDVPKDRRPDGIFDHWVLYDILPDTSTIPSNEFRGTPGANGRGTNVYVGPCPPDREHRYFFKLYAIDTKLGLPAGKTKKEIVEAMSGHIIEEAELMGRYDKLERTQGK